MDPEVELRKEMLREAERVLDHEVAAIEQLDQKTSHALTLTISGFSLLVLLATLSPGDPSPTSVVLLTAGGVANAVAAYLLTKEYHLESDADVHVGPDLDWISAAAGTGVSKAEYLGLVLQGFAEYHRHNERFVAEMKASRRRAVLVLLLAAVLYGAAALDAAVRATLS